MTTDPALQAMQALRSISRNEAIKGYLLKNPPLYKTVLQAAMRFIGGETLEECFQTSSIITSKGHAFTVDFMGESTRNEKAAEEATEEFLKVIKKIQTTSSNASISLDLSHIGMLVDKELSFKNASMLVQKAKEVEIEVMISMEGIDRTGDILEIYKRLCETFENVGITLQAYLHRTEKDLKEALERPGKIRLVKGAYEVPSDQALHWGEKTDEAYKKYLKQIFSSGHLCSIASHDQKILTFANTYIKQHSVNTEKVEFEMLHGVTPELLSQMHDKGYKTREYIPYGKEWYLYLCHRLAENPLNIYQAISDAVGIK